MADCPICVPSNAQHAACRIQRNAGRLCGTQPTYIESRRRHAASWQFKLGEKIGDFGFVCPMVGGSSLKMTTSGSAEAYDHASAPLSPALEGRRTRCLFYREGSRWAEPGLCVFRERARLPLGIKAALARRSPPYSREYRQAARQRRLKQRWTVTSCIRARAAVIWSC